jgi:hypothetical protein
MFIAPIPCFRQAAALSILLGAAEKPPHRVHGVDAEYLRVLLCVSLCHLCEALCSETLAFSAVS